MNLSELTLDPRGREMGIPIGYGRWGDSKHYQI